MFDQLEEINACPKPFEVCTVSDLWTDEYTSKQMLAFHLNGDNDVASRRTTFLDRSAQWIISQFDLREGRAVVDFGCGPGLYTQRLARTKAAVTGIDFSKNSLEYARTKAREEGLAINYVHQNYLEFHSDQKYDLILMIFCDFCALSPEQRKTLLQKFKALLKPEGSVLLDAYLLNAFHRKAEGASYELNPVNNFWTSEKCYCFLNSFKYDDVKVTLDKYTLVEQDRTRRIFNWLQYYSQEDIACEFEESGLKIEKYLANVAGDKFDPNADEFAIIAKAR